MSVAGEEAIRSSITQFDSKTGTSPVLAAARLGTAQQEPGTGVPGRSQERGWSPVLAAASLGTA
jgi:hypothetical protein